MARRWWQSCLLPLFPNPPRTTIPSSAPHTTRACAVGTATVIATTTTRAGLVPAPPRRPAPGGVRLPSSSSCFPPHSPSQVASLSTHTAHTTRHNQAMASAAAKIVFSHLSSAELRQWVEDPGRKAGGCPAAPSPPGGEAAGRGAQRPGQNERGGRAHLGLCSGRGGRLPARRLHARDGHDFAGVASIA